MSLDAIPAESAPLVRDDVAQTYTLALPEGGKAFATFRMRGDVLVLTHTEVPVHLEGHGYGSALMQAILDDVRARGEKIVPLCSFALAYMRQRPETQDLLAHDL